MASGFLNLIRNKKIVLKMVYIYHVSLTFLVLLFWTLLSCFSDRAFLGDNNVQKMTRKVKET